MKTLKETNLIAAIRNRPILWDPRIREYHNRLLTIREWTIMENKIGRPRRELRSKWKNLRDCFRRELRKIPKHFPGEDPDACRYAGSWGYFDQMTFLAPVLKARVEFQIEETGDDSTNDTTDSTKPTAKIYIKGETNWSIASDNEQEKTMSDVDPNETDNLHESYESSFTSSLQKFNTKPDQTDSALSNPSPNKQNSGSSEEQSFCNIETNKIGVLESTDDEDFHWFKSILPHVRKLSGIQKLKFRTQIQNILVSDFLKE